MFLPEPVLHTGLFIAHHATYIPHKNTKTVTQKLHSRFEPGKPGYARGALQNEHVARDRNVATVNFDLFTPIYVDGTAYVAVHGSYS